MALIPIWEKTTYTFNGTGMSYYITDASTGKKIFSGKAVAYPSTNSGEIVINKICENYVMMDYPVQNNSSSGTYIHPNAAKTFNLYNSSDTLLQTYEFYYNWSYLASRNPMTEKVNGKYIPGMYKFRTIIYNNLIQTEFDRSDSPSLGYTTSACGDYALFYLNRYGGWDCFAIEGNVIVKQRDEFVVNKYETAFDREDLQTREVNRFRNEITHYWTINTNWLTDAESERLATHLFSSNQVYLQLLLKNTVVPVEIVDTSVEYKTFKGEKKLVSYTINLMESNKKVIL